MDSSAFASYVGPAEEEEAYTKFMRKLRKLKTIATLLGLATPSGLDLSEAKLQAATGMILKISVKDSGRTNAGRNGVAYPRLYIDVIGPASKLEPVTKPKLQPKADIETDEWDIPF